MFRTFKKDPLYLARYHTRWGVSLALVNALLIFFLPPDSASLALFLPGLVMLASVQIEVVILASLYCLSVRALQADFSHVELLWMPLAACLGWCFSGLIHCASHDSLRPKWLNRPVGELMGLLQLSGFADWKIVHVFHHSFTDDPEKDPHPPLNLSYWAYTKGMRGSILKSYLSHFFKIFGNTETSMKALQRFGWAARFNQYNKVLFWFLVLGPKVFAVLYTTSIVAKMFQFSWLNWAAHRPSDTGVEIRNLESGLYPIANFFSFGLYVHKNHHLAPQLFDPRSYSKNMTPEPEQDAA